jgi:salicylate hydroxylase
MSQDKPHVLISGGGIGGMAAALSLLKLGFDVDVYEQAQELRELGAGVQISPNGTRALNWLGVLDELQKLSVKTDAKEIKLWNTGQTWKLFDLGAEAIQRYGFPYVTVYRPDLLQVLADAARRLKPDVLHLGKRCTGVSEAGDRVTLHLDSGEKVSGDAVIGADGVHSAVRGALLGVDKASFTGMTAWRGTIPMERLPDEYRRSVAVNWVGPGGHVVHYPLRGGTLMNFVGIHERQDWQIESWSTQGTPEECARDFTGWHPSIHTIIKSAPSLFKWALMARPPLDWWTRGRVSLLGDACHSTLPLLAQGAVMAIEDSVTLGRCMDKWRSDIPTALKHYEQARIAITAKKVQSAAEQAYRFHNEALRDEATAAPFIDREWGRQAILERYEWVFTDDVTANPI